MANRALLTDLINKLNYMDKVGFAPPSPPPPDPNAPPPGAPPPGAPPPMPPPGGDPNAGQPPMPPPPGMDPNAPPPGMPPPGMDPNAGAGAPPPGAGPDPMAMLTDLGTRVGNIEGMMQELMSMIGGAAGGAGAPPPPDAGGPAEPPPFTDEAQKAMSAPQEAVPQGADPSMPKTAALIAKQEWENNARKYHSEQAASRAPLLENLRRMRGMR